MDFKIAKKAKNARIATLTIIKRMEKNANNAITRN